MPQMFDVRPVNRAGNLDLERINGIRRVVRIGSSKQELPRRAIREQESGRPVCDVRSVPASNNVTAPDNVPTPDIDVIRAEADRFRDFIEEEKRNNPRVFPASQDFFERNSRTEKPRVFERRLKRKRSRPSLGLVAALKKAVALSGRALSKVGTAVFVVFSSMLGIVPFFGKSVAGAFRSLGKSVSHFFGGLSDGIKKTSRSVTETSSRNFYPAENIFARPSFAFAHYSPKQHLRVFSVASLIILILISGTGLFSRGLSMKNIVMENGNVAYADLMDAKDGIKGRNFNDASFKFKEAYGRFNEISDDLNSLGGVIVEASRFVPFASKLSTGAHLANAGKDISQIGSLTSDLLASLEGVKNPLKGGDSVSYLDMFEASNKKVEDISSLTKDLEDNLDDVNLDDIPEAQRDKFAQLKKKLPEINKFLDGYNKESKIFSDILGGNGPRKYLFLFQNNQEMRATGGFIGTYAALDIFNGHIKKFTVDGIFNPDGQLKERIIPPAPIQKISANWSLHDSNWFPDFPKSAEKAAWFYEKTGGPTVDGVITMTPTVLQRLLEVTGPIEMKDYGVTIDKDNFLETIQQEVEVNYDKEINQPKKILADLAPEILDRIFNARDFSDITKTMKILSESLNEKHILIYSRNYDVEKILSDNGWSGEVLNTDKDYLSVINTNVNGYKTDGVIDQKIEHAAEIQDDGSIVDKVTITRHHNGGDTQYDWWNKVNADYMRVYVPKGSKLLNVTGQTREFDSPPVDYSALGFKTDADLQMEDQTATIDEESGTKIYEDSDKTVFGNWVYVSPKETSAITYTYLLPFKLDTNLTTKPADTYSLLVQKQSGSISSDFSSKITYPDFYENIWKYPEESAEEAMDVPDGKSGIEVASDLKTDDFIGMAFKKKDSSESKGILNITNVFK